MSRTIPPRSATSKQSAVGRGKKLTSSTASLTQSKPLAKNKLSVNRNVGLGEIKGKGSKMEQNPEDAQTPYQPQASTPLDQRIAHGSGFTMYHPNEKKRQEISQQAEREMRQYEQYRQQKKPTAVNYVGTVGGGQNVVQARQQQVAAHIGQNKTNRLLKEQERKLKLREAEEKELELKKIDARRKAELNERKEAARKEVWREDMQRKNQAFLDQLQAQNKAQAHSSSLAASQPPGLSSQSLGQALAEPRGQAVTRPPSLARPLGEAVVRSPGQAKVGPPGQAKVGPPGQAVTRFPGQAVLRAQSNNAPQLLTRPAQQFLHQPTSLPAKVLYSKPSQTEKLTSTTSGECTRSKGDESDRRIGGWRGTTVTEQRFPEPSWNAAASANTYSGNNDGTSSSGFFTNMYVNEDPLGGGDGLQLHDDDILQNNLDVMQDAFPQYARSALAAILEQAGGSLEAAFELLDM